MFALLAAIVFFLALVHVALGSINMLYLGLLLLSLEFVFAYGPVWLGRFHR
jgi:hypothetical protein